MTDNKLLRGFARMSPEKRKALAAKGGAMVPAEKRSFSQNRDLAKEAGTKGGTNVPPEKRTFSVIPGLAVRAGRAGGMVSSKKAK